MARNRTTALSRQALGGQVFIVTPTHSAYNNTQIKQASNLMKQVPLTGKYGSGKFAIVDDEDYEFVLRYKWHVTPDGYVVANGGLKMHWLLMMPPSGLVVDHRHGNKFDNRRSQLRVCTYTDNNRNRSTPPKSTTGYRGVVWRNGCYKAQIRAGSRSIQLGKFSTAIEAAYVYDQFAMQLHGEFATLNFLGGV